MGCALSTKRDWSGNDTDLDISFFVLIPLRPLPLSSTFVVTRSIFDMMFIQGTSRLTIADMAERTPLLTHMIHSMRTADSVVYTLSAPEEFVLVLHELGFNEIYCTRSHAESLEVADKCREEWVMCVEFNLTWISE